MNGKLKSALAVPGRVWASRVGKLAVLGAVGLGLTTGGAVAATSLPINSVGPNQIQTGGVWGGDVHRNTIAEDKLGWAFRSKVDGGIKTADDAKAAAAKAQADAKKALEQGGTAGADGKSYGCDGNVVDAEHPAAKCPGTPGNDGEPGKQGESGKQGDTGAAGDSYLKGAYYAVGFYDKGDTNAGAIATVACKAETDTAISGGAQTVGLDATANTRNTPVSSSFPGRMDWSTNTPKAGRLDGWVVQFGGNAGATSDKAPEKVKVWALCVPGLDIPVTQTYLQSQDG